MNIIRVCPSFNPTKKTLVGLSTHITPLSIELDKKRIKQTIITSDCEVKKYKRIKIIKYKIRRFTFFISGIIVYKIIRRIKNYDLIEIHNPGFFSFFLFKPFINKKIIFTLHCSLINIITNIRFRSLKSIKEAFYFLIGTIISAIFSDIIIVGSIKEKNELKWFANKIKVIPAGYDEKIFHNLKVKKKNQLLFVGRFVYTKGIDTLLKSYVLLSKVNKDIKLVMVGGSEKDEYYKELIKKIEKLNLKDKIYVQKYVSQKKLAKMYNESLLTVLPSLAEGTSKAGIESLACGTPVIATDIAGFKDYIKNGYNGYLIKRKDYIGLYNTILALINNRNILRKMEKNCLRTAKKYTWKENVKKRIKIYKELIKR